MSGRSVSGSGTTRRRATPTTASAAPADGGVIEDMEGDDVEDSATITGANPSAPPAVSTTAALPHSTLPVVPVPQAAAPSSGPQTSVYSADFASIVAAAVQAALADARGREAQPAPRAEVEGNKLALDKHPCVRALTSMPSEYKCSTYKGVNGPILWMRAVFDFVDSAFALFTHLSTKTHTQVIAQFMVAATSGSSLESFVQCMVDVDGGRVKRILSFKNWEDMKKAIRKEIITPARRLQIAHAFAALKFSGDIDTLIRAIDEHIATVDMSPAAALQCKRDKIIQCMPEGVMDDIQTTMMGDNESVLDMVDMDKLVNFARFAIKRNKGTTKPPQVSAVDVSSGSTPSESAASSSTSSGPGGALARKGSGKQTKKDDRPNTKEERTARLTKYADSLLRNDRRFEKATHEAVMQRFGEGRCALCNATTHLLRACTAAAFTPSN